MTDDNITEVRPPNLEQSKVEVEIRELEANW